MSRLKSDFQGLRSGESPFCLGRSVRFSLAMEARDELGPLFPCSSLVDCISRFLLRSGEVREAFTRPELGVLFRWAVCFRSGEAAISSSVRAQVRYSRVAVVFMWFWRLQLLASLEELSSMAGASPSLAVALPL